MSQATWADPAATWGSLDYAWDGTFLGAAPSPTATSGGGVSYGELPPHPRIIRGRSELKFAYAVTCTCLPVGVTTVGYEVDRTDHSALSTTHTARSTERCAHHSRVADRATVHTTADIVIRAHKVYEVHRTRSFVRITSR